MKKLFLTSLLLSGLLLACSNTATDTSVEEQSQEQPEQKANVLFVIATNGGCMMAGPNCPRYEVRADGTFDVYRTDQLKSEKQGVIDKTLFNDWYAVAQAVDVDKLKGSLGEGECRACFDGVDYIYTLKLYADETLNSQKHDFDTSIKFFKLSEQLHRYMQEKAPLEMKMRGQ